MSLTTRAIFFDVDFTLIFPKSIFDATGYQSFGDRHGLRVIPDPRLFAAAVEVASSELEMAEDLVYRPELFVRYARRVLEEIGAQGPGLDACAQEIYDEWAECRHFSLYDDVKSVLHELHGKGFQLGLISNTHRCLELFKRHFGLEVFITSAVSSCAHGFMKPHPSIFEEALRMVGVAADEALMVGDSMKHDIVGALGVGMRGVLLVRSGLLDERLEAVPVISSLRELPAVVSACSTGKLR